jgi:hypothetical protein
MASELTEKGTINSVPDRTGHGGGKELELRCRSPWGTAVNEQC